MGAFLLVSRGPLGLASLAVYSPCLISYPLIPEWFLLVNKHCCEIGKCDTTLNGHKGAVTILRFNKTGSLLASGSKDNDIVLWDVLGEVGFFCLRGHRDQVTDLAFLDSGNKLVSASKDKFLTVWDLDTKHCTQIIGGHHSEVWSLDVDPDQRYLVIRSADLELRFYTIKHENEFRTSNTIENIVVSIYTALTMSSIIEFRYSLEFK